MSEEKKENGAVEKFKQSGVGQAILGEDGKFDKEDIERMAQNAKDSKLGKAILGEDGKLDKEDFKRISEDAGEAVKGTVDKVKGIFKK